MDDGSKDGTVGVVQKYMEKHDQLRLLKLHANGGKGAALKIGVRESLGDMILIVSYCMQVVVCCGLPTTGTYVA